MRVVFWKEHGSLFEMLLAWIFSAYSLHLAGNEPSIQKRCFAAARAVETVVEKNSLFEDSFSGRLKTGLLLLKIARHESAFDPTAKNQAGDCGVGQVASSTAARLGSSCLKMQANIVEGFTISLAALQEVKEACGPDPMRFMGAYASGVCGGAQEIVREMIPLL